MRGIETAKEHLPTVPDELLADWMVVRKAKRAGPVTGTVARMIEREAAAAGITVAEAIRECCERGWQGFRAEWVSKRTTSERERITRELYRPNV